MVCHYVSHQPPYHLTLLPWNNFSAPEQPHTNPHTPTCPQGSKFEEIWTKIILVYGNKWGKSSLFDNHYQQILYQFAYNIQELEVMGQHYSKCMKNWRGGNIILIFPCRRPPKPTKRSPTPAQAQGHGNLEFALHNFLVSINTKKN